MAITIRELRVPLTSVLSNAKLGVKVFVDAAKTIDSGASLGQAEWHRGAGGGVFLIAPLVRLNLNVAHGFSGGTRSTSEQGLASEAELTRS